MDNDAFLAYKVEDRSYVSFVKREIHTLTTQAGFSTARTGEIDIIVSELTSNLVKHAHSGELFYKLSNEGDNKLFEIFCIDNGPGIADVAKMMKDGVSTSNTSGNGLGAINRLSDFFQMYSLSGWGTVAYSRVYMKVVKPVYFSKTDADIRAMQVCYPGERLCGDGYYIKKNKDGVQIFVGDGLGHGPHAHEAVQQAVSAFKLCNEAEDPIAILHFIHERVKKTRGLVGTVATLDYAKKKWKICGVGNINTRMCQGVSSKSYMSNNGIIGLSVPHTMHNYETDAERNQIILMFSDGIKNRWEISKYPLLFKYDPAIIAAVIFKDNARRNDDMTVLAGKLNF